MEYKIEIIATAEDELIVDNSRIQELLSEGWELSFVNTVGHSLVGTFERYNHENVTISEF